MIVITTSNSIKVNKVRFMFFLPVMRNGHCYNLTIPYQLYHNLKEMSIGGRKILKKLYLVRQKALRKSNEHLTKAKKRVIIIDCNGKVM